MECAPQVLIEFESTDLDKNLCMADIAFSNECDCTTSLEKTTPRVRSEWKFLTKVSIFKCKNRLAVLTAECYTLVA